MQVSEGVETVGNDDIERSPDTTANTGFVDPFQIRDGLVPENELAGLRRRKKGKSIAQYQLQQNNVRVSVLGIVYAHIFYQLILDLLKPMEDHTEDAKVDEEAARLPVSTHTFQSLSIFTYYQVKIAVYASLLSNVVLCILQREFHSND
jgi:hypothetical protein